MTTPAQALPDVATASDSAAEACTTRLLLVLNPRGGTSRPEELRAAMARHFAEPQCITTVYETTGDEDLPTVIREQLKQGFDLVVAAGGDGTVSEVGEALVGTDVPLGIIPAGTGNVLAHDLGIPLDLEAACQLLAGPHRVAHIDAMQVGEKYYIVSIGIGLDAVMVRDTEREAKRRIGRAAYILTIARNLVGLGGKRFTIVADGRHVRYRAIQVLAANSAAVGLEPLSWGPHIRPDDGQIDICIVSARTLREVASVVWDAARSRQHQNRNLRYLTARKSIMIVPDHPLPVQADGELIDATPLQITVVPQAVRVIVPLEGKQ